MCKKCGLSTCKERKCCKVGPRGIPGPRGPKGDPGISAGGVPKAYYAYAGSLYGADGGLPSQNGFLTLPFNVETYYAALEITIEEDGQYLAFLDYAPYSTYQLSLRSRIYVNNTISSIRSHLVSGGNTPPLENAHYVHNQPLFLKAGDVIKPSFMTFSISGGSPTPGSIFITHAVIHLIKVQY